MNANDIKVKMDASFTKYEKRLATTKKFEDRVTKNLALIKKNGWDIYFDENGNINPYAVVEATGNQKAFDVIYAYEDNVRSAEESKKKEAEVLATYEGWVKKYNNALKLEDDIDNLPEAFKQVIDMLADEWTTWDMNDLDRMNKMKAELPSYEYGMSKEQRAEYIKAHDNFRKAFPITRETELKRGREYLYDKNKNTAKAYLNDLMHRIKDTIGEIKSFDHIHYAGKALNGFVEGTLGNARLETILAGGYNIQRLHYRVLVHKM